MGRVVHDGRSLGRVHLSHHSFFKVLSCGLHLGNGEGRERDRDHFTEGGYVKKSLWDDHRSIYFFLSSFSPLLGQTKSPKKTSELLNQSKKLYERAARPVMESKEMEKGLQVLHLSLLREPLIYP